MPMPDPRGSPHIPKQLGNWAEVFLVFPLEPTRILFSLSFLFEFRVASGSGYVGRICVGRPRVPVHHQVYQGHAVLNSWPAPHMVPARLGTTAREVPPGRAPPTASCAICLLLLAVGRLGHLTGQRLPTAAPGPVLAVGRHELIRGTV